MVQMRPRLAAGEIDFMVRQFHRKQCCDGIGGCLRPGGFKQLSKPTVMMRDQLAGAACAVEVMPVMSADDKPVGSQPFQIAKILIIMGKNVTIRFAKADRDVWRDAAKQEINRQIDPARRIDKPEMGRRMPGIKPNLPVAGDCPDCLAGIQDLHAGQWRDKLAVIVSNGAVTGHDLIRKAVIAVGIRGHLAIGVVAHLKGANRHVMFGPADHDRRACAFAKRAGMADMIAVVMGDDDAGDGALCGQLRQDGVPLGTCVHAVDSSVDQQPPFICLKREEIDVVQPEGHAEPKPDKILGKPNDVPALRRSDIKAAKLVRAVPRCIRTCHGSGKPLSGLW